MAISVKTTVKVVVGGLLAWGLFVAGNFGYGLYQISGFYDPEKITENFRSAHISFPHTYIRAGEPWQYSEKKSELPDIYQYNGDVKIFTELMKTVGTTGLIITQGDNILVEEYFQGEKASDRHSMFSVTKSFVSALLGIAIDDGLIDDIDDPILKYLPQFKDTGYDGTTIRDIMTMSSGVRFNEDYGDMLSDVNRMSMTIGMNGSLDEFATSLEREREPGTYNHYVSVDTHVLGMLLKKVTGRTLTSYLQEKIWQPIGMENDAIWMVDGEEMDVAMGGMLVSLRDMARFGRLYLHGGNWNGKQIVPASWVKDSTTPSAPRLMPGFDNPASGTPFGYAFQWWTPDNPHGDFMAMGIYHQFIYIDPTTGIVIAMTSANKGYNKPENIGQGHELITAFQNLSLILGDTNWQGADDKELMPEDLMKLRDQLLKGKTAKAAATN